MPFDGKLPAKPGGIAADLIRAKEILQQKGWAHRAGRGPEGQVCAGNAIFDVVGTRDRFRPLSEAFGAANGMHAYAIGSWNDSPYRTFDQVLAAFDRAIDAALVAEAQP